MWLQVMGMKYNAFVDQLEVLTGLGHTIECFMTRLGVVTGLASGGVKYNFYGEIGGCVGSGKGFNILHLLFVCYI